MAKASTTSSTKAATKKVTEKTKTATREKPEKTEKAKRGPSLYNIFVKENMPIWKAANPDKSQKEAMAGIGAMWKDAPENPNRGQESKSKTTKKSEKKTAAKKALSSSDTES